MPKYDEDQIRHLELMGKALEKGQSINAIFIAAGYATFFALWENTKGCSTPTSHMIAGACITLSVALYVVWMATGLVALNITMASLIKQAESAPRLQKQDKPIDPAGAIAYLKQMLDDPDAGLAPAQRASWRLLLLMLEIGKKAPYALGAIIAPAIVGIAIVFSTYVHGAWLSYQGMALNCAAS